jgi:hypothetical protein
MVRFREKMLLKLNNIKCIKKIYWLNKFNSLEIKISSRNRIVEEIRSQSIDFWLSTCI